MADPLRVPFVPGEQQFTRAWRRHVKWIVIHTMEVPEVGGIAERMARRFADSEKKKSFHFAVDHKDVVQLVDDQHVAWHAPGANKFGIGIEHAGSASQTPSQWADDYSVSMLEKSALLCASLAEKWQIPIVHVTPEEMREGKSGFCGHDDVTKAWGKTDHTDPGPNFPWGQFLAMVRAAPLDAVEFVKP